LERELVHAKSGVLDIIFLLIRLMLTESMTKEAIYRAIARGGRPALGKDLQAMTYEVMLPGGMAMLM
jgi:transcriptional/translational regulatory protein YebC/TACO1